MRAYTHSSPRRRIAQPLGLIEEPHTDRPSKWHSIARHVPGRTNKDCRKRWCATMASIVSKGGWSSEEDRKLLDAVEKHGTKCVVSPFLFAEVLIINVIPGGLSSLHWWKPVTVVVSTSDYMLQRTVVDVDRCRMRKTVARHTEPRYRQEVSATSHRSRTMRLSYVYQCLERGGGTVKRFARISDIVFTLSNLGHQVAGCCRKHGHVLDNHYQILLPRSHCSGGEE